MGCVGGRERADDPWNAELCGGRHASARKQTGRTGAHTAAHLLQPHLRHGVLQDAPLQLGAELFSVWDWDWGLGGLLGESAQQGRGAARGACAALARARARRKNCACGAARSAPCVRFPRCPETHLGVCRHEPLVLGEIWALQPLAERPDLPEQLLAGGQQPRQRGRGAPLALVAVIHLLRPSYELQLVQLSVSRSGWSDQAIVVVGSVGWAALINCCLPLSLPGTTCGILLRE